MNYLAHAYLSFQQPQILVGNMISDFVKGNKKFDYPELIQKGIALHRSIDVFTDMHEATKQAKEFFRPHYRLYSGAFVDVVYDHFLAKDEKEFPGDSLKQFSSQTYAMLHAHTEWLPERFNSMLPHMKAQDWLYHYQFIWGAKQSFKGLVYRTKYLTESALADDVLEKNYTELENCYQRFIADVKQFAAEKYNELMSAKL